MNAKQQIVRVGLAALVLFGLCGSRPGSAGLMADDPAAAAAITPRFAYHLRVVRIAGVSEYRGVAIGCGRVCGRPIVVPAGEAWGSPEQLAGLARSLGGVRADAVTGFIVLPGPDGAANFDATIYPGEAVVELVFAARTPEWPGGPHDLQLTLTAPETGQPLAEARVLSASERTIALAAPSPVEGEWLALAVTTLDPAAAEARVTGDGPAPLVEGVVTNPELIEKVEPRYTPRARKEGRQGKVAIDAVIDLEGKVQAPMIVRVDPGIEDLAAAAVDAVAKWRYRPATRAGLPVTAHFFVEVEFRLE
jgi:TonB family protein